MISSVTTQPCYRVCLFFYNLHRLIALEFQVIALEFLIKQILQPAGTLPFLQNLVMSPVRHAELEQEDHWHYYRPTMSNMCCHAFEYSLPGNTRIWLKEQKRTKNYAGKVIIRFYSITYCCFKTSPSFPEHQK